MNQFIGTLYFSSSRDEAGKPVSKYEGVIVAFTVKRDDGTEFEVREEKRSPRASMPLKYDDVSSLKPGQELEGLTGDKYYVVRTYPIYGDIWLRDLTDSKLTVKKYTDLRWPSVQT